MKLPELEPVDKDLVVYSLIGYGLSLISPPPYNAVVAFKTTVLLGRRLWPK
jgi:hypothetical protein